MADPEEATPPEEPPEKKGALGFLNSGTALIGAVTGLVLAIAALVTALATTGVFSSHSASKTTSTTTTTTPPPTTTTTTTTATTTTPAVSLFDQTVQPAGRVYFEGKTMFLTTSQPARPFLVLAQSEKAYEDVAMTVNARWVSGARDFGIGLVCRYDSPANYYLVSILSDGRYNIVRYRNGKLDSLTGGIRHDDRIDSQSNTIKVRCVDDQPTTVSLSVDGQQIAQVKDQNGIASGNVGIRVGSNESGVTTAFDDFTLRSL